MSKYQKEFKEQATRIATWDRLLVENGEKIQKLYLQTFEAERASNEIERQLVALESQQDELSQWLDKYEGDVNEMFVRQMGGSGHGGLSSTSTEAGASSASSVMVPASGDIGVGGAGTLGYIGGSGYHLTGPDQEREKTYKMAEKLTERLNEMGKDLSKMIKEINEISGTLNKGNKPDDPLTQIVRVLNGHLAQLQWIDSNASALQAKVQAAHKATGGMTSQFGASESDTAESFYRSYMGRR